MGVRRRRAKVAWRLSRGPGPDLVELIVPARMPLEVPHRPRVELIQIHQVTAMAIATAAA